MPDALVIGYGNELRRDDGVGPEVARAVGKLRLPGVRVIACHQLVPELAGLLAAAGRVVFVDATIHPGDRVRLTPLEPAAQPDAPGHTGAPRSLLALARTAFGRCPAAWQLTIPVESLDFGEGLSPRAAQGVAVAIQEIKSLLAASCSPG
jgi:hydrogenase maturation protease